MNFYSVFKHVAFKIDPEFVHDMSIHSGHLAPRVVDLFSPLKPNSRYEFKSGELTWSFPVGLAAGFDKNAMAINFFKRFGLGAVEVGTVTKLPQKGNEKPRIFRHSKIKSLQNSMGFPNMGSHEILKNIQENHKNDICLGVNIGKNKNTSEQDTPEEYAYLYQQFVDVSDYLVVNISSPNTPGLRSFQKKDKLQPILGAIKEQQKVKYKPVFIKIAPDLNDDDLKMICELSKENDFSGIIATNTTIQHDYGVGGLSGAYIKQYAKAIRNKTCEYLHEDPKQIVIGVGGIDCYQDIQEFWRAGGSFVQVYTPIIYEGPELLKKIAKDLDADMKKHDVSSVQDLHQALTKMN